METNIQNAIIIAIVGFTAVMIMLSVYSAIIAAVNKLNVALEVRRQNKTIALSASSAVNKTGTNQLDEESVAVIMAAVTASMGERVRISKISFSNPISQETAWTNLSKASKFQAHSIQKKRVQYEGK
jgi:Na+-transporting methylmalonyl-CoA/oxaloacetate decarboxylase gamma subunit